MHNEQVDSHIEYLIENRGFRVAAQYAATHAAHALNAAASIYMTRLGEEDKALELWINAVSADPKNAVAQNNLACALLKIGKCEKALEHSCKAVELSETPQEVCYFTKGNILSKLGRYDEAATCFEKTLEINPQSSMTHILLGNLYLAMSRFKEGLAHDEWRFAAGHSKRFRQRFIGVDWDGESSLEGKLVCLFNEQGSGDAIQYSRYIPMLRMLGCRLMAEVQGELVELFESTSWFEEVHVQSINAPTTVPPHDYAISIGSLPYLFDSNLDSIPIDPYLSVENGNLKEKLVGHDDCFKVGIIWAGSKWHKNDKNRSCYLKYFKPLSQIPGVKLFSLQKGDMVRAWMNDGANVLDGSENYEVVNLLDDVDFEVVDLSESINSFKDTADALQGLDLLICVDTSAAHLAGATGRPAWVLLPHHFEWRWQKKWYRSVRTLHQPQPGDWHGLMVNVTDELKRAYTLWLADRRSGV